MASVEHQLLFLLTAKVDSAFGAGFSTAQKALADMQKQIRDSKKAIGKIDEYEKAVSALDAMRSATGTATEKIQQQQAEVDALRTELQGLGINLNDTAGEQARLAANIETTSAEMVKWQENVNRIRDIASIFTALSMAAGEVGKYVSVVTTAMNDAVTVAKDFQYTMSAVKAVSGASAQEFAALEAEAKQLGATTVFTAQQVAEAMEVQALAGWETQEMLAGLPAVVHLAAAAGEDIAEVTSIVTDGLNAFGMAGERGVNRFVDAIVSGATNANTNVSLIGESLEKVETTAGNLHYSIEDVTLTLAAMANQAQKGTTAGTSLNTILTRMSSNQTAQAAMERLGVSMYDTYGTALPLVDVMGQMRAAFDGMTDAEAQLAAYQIAGMRGMRGLLAITNTSQESWDSLAESIYNSAGAAQTIADIRMDNYQGQLYLLTSAQEALQTSYGESLLDMKTAWAGVKTGIVNDINDIVKAHEWMGPATYGFTEILSKELSLVQTLAPIAMSVSMMVATMGQEVLKTVALAGGIGLAVAGIAAVGAVEIAYIQKATSETEALKESTKELEEKIAERRSNYQQEVSAYESQHANGAMGAEEFQIRKSNLDAMQSEQEELKSRLEEAQAAMDAFEAENPYFEMGKSGNVVQSQNYANLYYTLNTAKAAYDEHMAEMEAEKAVFQQWVESNGGEYITGSSVDDWLTVYDAMMPIADAYAEVYQSAYDSISGQFSLWDEAGKYLNVYGEAYQQAFDKAKESFAGMFALWDGVTYNENPINFATMQGNQTGQLEFWTTYRNGLEALKESGVDLSNIWSQLTDGSMNAYDAVQAMASALADGGPDALADYADRWRDILSVQEEVAAFAAEAEIVTFDDLMGNLTSQMDAWAAYRENIGDLLGAGVDLSGIMNQLDGSASAMSLVAALAQELGENGAVSVQKFIDETGALAGSWQSTAEIIAGLSPEIQAAINELVNSDAWDGLQGNADAIVAVAQEVVADWAAETGNDALVAPVLEGVIAAVTAAQTEGESGMPGAAEAAASAFTSTMDAQGRMFMQSGAGAIQKLINGMNSKRSLAISSAASLGAAINASLSARTTGLVGTNIYAFAGGTNYAPSGLALVGEEGPELLYLNGGEKILPAQQTRAKLSAAGAKPEMAKLSTASYASGGTSLQLTYSPQINAGSGTDAAGIRRILDEDKDSLMDFLDDWANEREINQRRGAY